MTKAPASSSPNQTMGEFIALVALLISLVALSIDVMLPALPAIGKDLAVMRANETQLVISCFFLGFGIGQFFYGPVSDSLGRKPTILAGLLIFLIGCVLSMSAENYETMLIGRVLQGLGAASPRTVMVAVVRDQCEGRFMARVMSFVMAVFILVPALAPALGQTILWIADWRAIFLCLIALSLIATIWMVLRLEETLPDEKRIPLSFMRILRAAREVLATRASLGYTVAAGVAFGAFIGYLNSAQQIFHDVFDAGEMFPVLFGGLALAIGCSSLVNAKLVMRYGMHLLSFLAAGGITALSCLYVSGLLLWGADPPLWSFMLWGTGAFFCIGILFGNLNALAMEPLGHIAGTGVAIVGAFSSLLSLALGIVIGQAFDGTVLPLVSGFALLGAVSGLIMRLTSGCWIK